MSPGSVEGGQANSTGTVRLTTQAPGGGATVTLASDNTTIATVPSSVTVASGSTANTFVVTTLAVSDSKTVTITATYLGVTKTGTFIVTETAKRAVFSVKDGARGADTCTITGSAGTLDCTFDGSDSKGTVAKYYWTTTVGSSVTEFNTTSASSTPQTICDSFKGGTPVTIDGRSQYLNMTVKLQVADSSDKKSDPASKTVRVYPGSQCGYGF